MEFLPPDVIPLFQGKNQNRYILLWIFFCPCRAADEDFRSGLRGLSFQAFDLSTLIPAQMPSCIKYENRIRFIPTTAQKRLYAEKQNRIAYPLMLKSTV